MTVRLAFESPHGHLFTSLHSKDKAQSLLKSAIMDLNNALIREEVQKTKQHNPRRDCNGI